MQNPSKNQSKIAVGVVAIFGALLGWYYHLSRQPLAWRCQDSSGEWHSVSAALSRVTETPEGWVVDLDDQVQSYNLCWRTPGVQK